MLSVVACPYSYFWWHEYFQSPLFTAYLSAFDLLLAYEVATLSEACKTDHSESQNSLKLSFTNI